MEKREIDKKPLEKDMKKVFCSFTKNKKSSTFLKRKTIAGNWPSPRQSIDQSSQLVNTLTVRQTFRTKVTE